MTHAEIFWTIVGVWFIGAVMSAFWLGYRDGREEVDRSFPVFLLAAAVWPIMVTFGAPILGANYRRRHEARRAVEEARKIRIEAEKQVIREERLRSAHLRPKRRLMDLSK